MDLTQAKDASLVDELVLKALGEKAKSIPLTATLDPQGRLTQFALDIPAAGADKAHRIEVRYTNYGKVAAASPPPAADTVEAKP